MDKKKKKQPSHSYSLAYVGYIEAHVVWTTETIDSLA